ncbi:MAG: UDP-N-acetylmuramoyl-L-alanine--D-glutamate ligase, partial [Alphaproteobacteria bacterium]|nr:UDP-N-acetylmuramoyl-L-alanine--D-glutamate ligase [Alphaproteobacteria bacterium]
MIVTAYKDQHVIVLGLGVTGTATARALKAGGARIGGWDGNPEVQARQCALLAIEPVDPFQLPATVALVVASPGIPSDHVVMQHIRLLSLPITSDIDLAYRTCPTARYVFVTGTNGKSTTVSLLAHMLEENKLQVAAGGNLGPPVLDLPAFDASGVYVLETSSYQLERMTEAVCSVAVWLNITPDHLEYHGSMAAYARAKMNIFHGHPRLSVVGQDDALSRAVTESLLANNNFVLPISVNHEGGIGITLDEHG